MPEITRDQRNSAPAILERYRERMDVALADVLCLENPELHAMMRYHVGMADAQGNAVANAQGKGVRSSLCMFACEALGGDPARALPVAAAVELVHNFSLIHDDIQDGDTERRHRSTVWALWGKPKALQAGNVMRVLADIGAQRLATDRVAPAVAARCGQVLSDACLEMIEGQYLDLEFEGRADVTTADYLDMIGRKTGALIRCAMQLGALAAQDDASTVEAMARCGHYLGLLFQIRDDYLGIWGSEEETGKATGNDLRRHKNSLPLVYAWEHAGPDDRERLRVFYSKETVGDDDVESVMGLLEGLGAPEYIQRLAQEQGVMARGALDGVEFVPGAMRELSDLLEFLLTRKR